MRRIDWKREERGMMGWGELRAMFWGAEWEKEGGRLGKQVKGCYQGTGAPQDVVGYLLWVPG